MNKSRIRIFTRPGRKIILNQPSVWWTTNSADLYEELSNTVNWIKILYL